MKALLILFICLNFIAVVFGWFAIFIGSTPILNSIGVAINVFMSYAMIIKLNEG